MSVSKGKEVCTETKWVFMEKDCLDEIEKPSFYLLCTKKTVFEHSLKISDHIMMIYYMTVITKSYLFSMIDL